MTRPHPSLSSTIDMTTQRNSVGIRFSIHTKIASSFLLLVIVMSSVYTLTSHHRIIDAMHEEIQKHGLRVARILSEMAAPYIFDSDYATILDVANSLIEREEIQQFTIIDASGKTWLTTHPKKETLTTDDPFYLSNISDNTSGFREVKRETGSSMEFVSPITALGKVRYLIKIELSLRSIEQQAFRRIRENLIISLTMIIAATTVALTLAHLLTTPINILVRGTRELAEGNLSHRIPVKASDETGLLSISFNQMAEKLEKELTVRQVAESQLQKYSEELEEIVSDRTAMLTETNILLSKEIEERKKAEVAVVESRERYRRFSEVSLDGIVFQDENGILDINTSFTTMLGYTRDMVIGEDLLATICLPDDLQNIRQTLLKDHESFIEVKARKRNGQTLPIEIQNRSYTYSDKVLKVTSIRDKSERKQLETQLQQAQRMEGIGRLAAGIAHDLNNILSGIVTMPQFLLLDLPDDSPMREPLQLILQSGENASVIVQDMLTLSRSNVTIESVLDLASLVRNYIVSPESMKLKQTHPGIVIRLDIEKYAGNIRGSWVHLTQALMNLVKNGADAIEGEGEITIGVKSAYFEKPHGNYETIAPGRYVCLSVTDSGTGIPPENIPFIFEPFYTKKLLGRSGTGLGMVIVWNTVKNHQGFIDIISTIGAGTKVCLYFSPTEEKVQETVKDPDLLSLRGVKETILVVDDVEEQRKIASAILTKLNYQVHSVTGGEEAVSFLRRHPVDLILLDMIMDPGIDGLETCKRIFADKPDARIIIASGYADSDMIEQALEMGVKQYIKKPYSISSLGKAVKDHLLRVDTSNINNSISE